jgi:hypothetical protein
MQPSRQMSITSHPKTGTPELPRLGRMKTALQHKKSGVLVVHTTTFRCNRGSVAGSFDGFAATTSSLKMWVIERFTGWVRL